MFDIEGMYLLFKIVFLLKLFVLGIVTLGVGLGDQPVKSFENEQPLYYCTPSELFSHVQIKLGELQKRNQRRLLQFSENVCAT